MSEVRTRIAPSPTGDPHVGTAYIALFNMCFARQQGGKFILRIEDTDQARSTPESEQEILDSLRWLHLDWDEGPDKGGDFGPYRQSERGEIYKEHANKLVDSGDAFYCFCTQERLDNLRKEQQENKEQPGYDGHCQALTPEQVKDNLDRNVPNVIRMHIPRRGSCVVNDMLRGEIEIDWHQVDMQILMKSDGMPTYHLANVVDDHLMGITHVIRGEEWINSAPKHLKLYEYFGWEPPVLIHMPLLRNTDKSKLSKRKNPTSIGYYKKMGYLSEAVVNFLGLMGWSMPSGPDEEGEELFSVQDMIDNFDIQRVSLGGPVFDTEKLDWLNGRYLREVLSDEEFIQRFGEWAFNPETTHQIVPLIKQRVERFSDVAPLAGFYFSGMPDIKTTDFEHKSLSQEDSVKILQFIAWAVEILPEWHRDRLEKLLMDMADQMDIKIRDFLSPVFIAIAGSSVSTSVIDSIAVIGKDITRARLRHAIGILGGVSKKGAKKLESEYRELDLK
ncbi:MAG: glutamate--tRNA ligase [Gammaproteobacteria bacterium]|nr:glutamate--tRNA ligase [Gammaproteobacteria bacterium]